jgi:hypothetical protein
MSDSPILVAGRALPQTGTVNSPLVMPAKVAQSNIVNAAAGAQTSVYKVKMIANGKTFNMLLPPSIESKHPGRSNPIQLPGLLIKAGIAISKLKIPGFFPIYQHLGVESLTVSLSGMFTGYDGISNLSDAAKWEGWQDLTVKEGQDSYTSACEFYDFAVKNKALIEVNIATSDGSFIPKKSESTTFRDSSSNIKFKGYVKEFELVYVRQDRNYYMIKFEIIDLGTYQCKTIKQDKKTTITNKAINDAAVGLGDINYVKNQFDALSDIDKANIVSSLLDSRALKKGYTQEDLLKVLNQTSDIYGTKDINRLKDILSLSSSTLYNTNGVDPFSNSLKKIQDGLKTSINVFTGGTINIKELSSNFLNKTITQLKEDTDNLIFEARSANLISVAKAEQLKTLNEIAATKNEKNIVEFLNKSVSNIQTYSNNSLNESIAKDLIDQEIGNTLNTVVVQPSIKQGIEALKNSSTAFDLTRNTKLNNLLNLGNINNSDFTGIPEPIVNLRYETLLERSQRKNTNLFPNAGIILDRVTQGADPVLKTDSIVYVGVTQDGKSLVYDVNRNGQYYGTYSYINQELIKQHASIKSELPVPLPNEGKDYFDSKTGVSFYNTQSNTPKDFSNIQEFNQINIQNPLKSSDTYYEVGTVGLNRVYSVTRNGIQLGIYEVGYDFGKLKRTITKI